VVPDARRPSQIHLSLSGKRGEMVVDFVASADGQEVKYTPAKGGATTTQAASCTQTTLNGYTAYFCNALMKGIKANTEVTYTVGSQATGYSAAYTFTNERAGSPLVFAMYADFGLGNDESLAALVKAGANKEFDAVIHAGDFGASFVVVATRRRLCCHSRRCRRRRRRRSRRGPP